jgi:hypothetical protein
MNKILNQFFIMMLKWRSYELFKNGLNELAFFIFYLFYLIFF